MFFAHRASRRICPSRQPTAFPTTIPPLHTFHTDKHIALTMQVRLESTKLDFNNPDRLYLTVHRNGSSFDTSQIQRSSRHPQRSSTKSTSAYQIGLPKIEHR